MWCKGKNYPHLQAPIEKSVRGFLPHESESLAPKAIFLRYAKEGRKQSSNDPDDIYGFEYKLQNVTDLR